MVTEINGNDQKHPNDFGPHFYKPNQDIQTNETRLMAHIEKKFNVKLANYAALHKWSCDNYAQFWELLVDFCGIRLKGEYHEVIDTKKSIADFPAWCEGSTVNYTEYILRGRDNDPAFISAHSVDDIVTKTYKQLKEDVHALATSFRQSVISVGDCVCGFLPNSYETALSMYATAAVGATWSSASVDFGPNGVLDRFKQVKPKILVTVEAATYKGKRFDLTEKLNQVVAGLPSLEKVILFNNLGTSIDYSVYDSADKFIDFQKFKNLAKDIPEPFVYEQVPFKQPLFIMFSSGTTGIPKDIVHTYGGTLLKHVEEHVIQGDSRSTDRIFFYTTCGWMMWNWLMSFLYSGGCIVLYDESPLEPDSHILPKIAAKTKSTIIGMGAKLYDEYPKMGTDLNSLYDLSHIRLVYSTGSPLKPECFAFISKSVAPGGSISGGTDIIGCFMGASLSLPVYPGECQCLYLGMDIHAFDHTGKPVLDEQGELVCTTPFPSMPSHFLADVDHVKYKKAYFERFPGVWAHGDFCQISSSTGGVVMLGRSDATLNRGGVRIGTAEIYSVVDTFAEIEDCIVAGQSMKLCRLAQWSCDNYAQFWELLVDFCGIRLKGEYHEVIDTKKSIADFPAWFEGSTVNYTEYILRGRDNDPAFISAHSVDDIVTKTYKQLKEDVHALATSFRQSGISVGDCVCGFLPNSYETALSMYATAAVGATWSSASVDFGPNGVLDRFKQVKPKILVTVEAATYKGKRFDLTEKLNQVVAGLPSLEKVILFNNLGTSIDYSVYDSADKFIDFQKFKNLAKDIPEPFVYEQVPFKQPLFIMFSSGTTGIPKAIVHTYGGTLLKHVEEHVIQGDSRSTDRIFFYTTCGWMMWNWLMSFLYSGGCIVLYDESPLEPDSHILPKIAAKTKSTIIGMGAKLYDEYTKMGTDFNSLYDLSHIRLVYSTGSPLKPECFAFISKSVAPGGSISGGTDIIGCFMGASLSLPVYPGECQCLYLGMDIHAFDHTGKPVLDEQGELVCTTPFPSMPSHFLADVDHVKYKKAYFERFPGVWV